MPRHVVDGRYFVDSPAHDRLPLVLDSPHSGIVFPADFQCAAPLAALYASWDAHVDELWSAAPHFGAMLVGALFPRAYIDPNRAINDIDPDLLAQLWPHPAEPGECSARGMGLIRRYALPGVPMYDSRLPVAKVERRLHDYYLPYRQAVRDALDDAWQHFGKVWHIDCHAMPSQGHNLHPDPGQPRADMVLCDRDGATCDPAFVHWIGDQLGAMGYRVAYNTPYQGGDLVHIFGRPGQGRHSVQLMINRALYMNEATCGKHEGFAELQDDLQDFLAALAGYIRERLDAR